MTSEIRNSKTYKKVIEHRKKCKKWGKEFCIECFGLGLGRFVDELVTEGVIQIK